MVRIATLLAMALLAGLPGTAAQADPVVNAANETHFELVKCHAYFSTVAHCATVSKMPKLAKQYEQISNGMLPVMQMVGEKANLSQDAMVSRSRLAIRKMGKLMEGGCQNISSATARFADRCKHAFENPVEVFDEYLAKK